MIALPCVRCGDLAHYVKNEIDLCYDCFKSDDTILELNEVKE